MQRLATASSRKRRSHAPRVERDADHRGRERETAPEAEAREGVGRGPERAGYAPVQRLAQDDGPEAPAREEHGTDQYTADGPERAEADVARDRREADHKQHRRRPQAVLELQCVLPGGRGDEGERAPETPEPDDVDPLGLPVLLQQPDGEHRRQRPDAEREERQAQEPVVGNEVPDHGPEVARVTVALHALPGRFDKPERQREREPRGRDLRVHRPVHGPQQQEAAEKRRKRPRQVAREKQPADRLRRPSRASAGRPHGEFRVVEQREIGPGRQAERDGQARLEDRELP